MDDCYDQARRQRGIPEAWDLIKDDLAKARAANVKLAARVLELEAEVDWHRENWRDEKTNETGSIAKLRSDLARLCAAEPDAIAKAIKVCDRAIADKDADADIDESNCGDWESRGWARGERSIAREIRAILASPPPPDPDPEAVRDPLFSEHGTCREKIAKNYPKEHTHVTRGDWCESLMRDRRYCKDCPEFDPEAAP